MHAEVAKKEIFTTASGAHQRRKITTPTEPVGQNLMKSNQYLVEYPSPRLLYYNRSFTSVQQ